MPTRARSRRRRSATPGATPRWGRLLPPRSPERSSSRWTALPRAPCSWFWARTSTGSGGPSPRRRQPPPAPPARTRGRRRTPRASTEARVLLLPAGHARSAGEDDVEGLGQPTLGQLEPPRGLGHPAAHEPVEVVQVAHLRDVPAQRRDLAIDDVCDVDGVVGPGAGGQPQLGDGPRLEALVGEQLGEGERVA